METGEILSGSIVLAAIILWNLITVWQIRSQTNRLIQEIRELALAMSSESSPHQE